MSFGTSDDHGRSGGETPRALPARPIDKTTVALFAGIHCILLFNAVLHDPYVGYDAPAHIEYIAALADARLPTPDDTYEFFSAPLPYLLPALVDRVLGDLGAPAQSVGFVAGKTVQLLNVLWSSILVIALLRISDVLRPGCIALKRVCLLILAGLPVYYKTIAMVRGEPLLAMLCVLAIYQVTALVRSGFELQRVVVLGFLLGLCVLARQWGALLLVSLLFSGGVIAVRCPSRRSLTVRTVVLSSVIVLLVAGWFYFHMRVTYGTSIAISREPFASYSLKNHPSGFFVDPALDRIFANPVRPAFNGRALPILYSEFWGDYWCYFVVWGRNVESREFVKSGAVFDESAARVLAATNRRSIAPYLGRVNAVSLIPSVILLAGSVYGAVAAFRRRRRLNSAVEITRMVATAFVWVSLAGYAWYVFRYPHRGIGDTVKATYMFQVLPFVALLSADMLVSVSARCRALWLAAILLWVIAATHNLPAMVSRYLLL